MRTIFRAMIFSAAMAVSQQGISEIKSHRATLEETEAARRINLSRPSVSGFLRTNVSHAPVPDDHDFAYVLMSGEDDGISEIMDLRRLITSNLPPDVKLVLLTTVDSAAELRRRFEAWIAADRLILATDKSSNNDNGFWARDAFPIPVIDRNTNTASLIAHQYFRPFDSFKTIAAAVQGNLSERSEVFVGGNLLADRKGNCFAVNSERLFDMSAAEIQDIYGCASVHILDHLAGIGDVDEVIKPLGDNIMLTNQTDYVDQLKNLGYNVIMLPSIDGTFRTYANSLVIGKTVFMPSFNSGKDSIAQKVYEDLGYKVVPIRSNFMSDYFNGSIHCQTMAYPALKKNELLDGLGLREL
jgi:hypothetical protein